MGDEVEESLALSAATISSCRALSKEINNAAMKILQAYRNGNKVILMGNGGSATQAQHIAAEFVNKFRIDRTPLPAISLSDNIANLTSISNDYGFDHVFEKQVRALGRKGDVAVLLTTSDTEDNPHGHSRNLLLAAKACAKEGVFTIGLLSTKSEKIGSLVDLPIKVGSTDTAKVQEAHLAILHIMCGIVEREFFKK